MAFITPTYFLTQKFSCSCVVKIKPLVALTLWPDHVYEGKVNWKYVTLTLKVLKESEMRDQQVTFNKCATMYMRTKIHKVLKSKMRASVCIRWISLCVCVCVKTVLNYTFGTSIKCAKSWSHRPVYKEIKAAASLGPNTAYGTFL